MTPLTRNDPRAVVRGVPMLHVADVDRSVAFYGLLGLELVGDHRVQGRRVWAHVGHPPGEIFFARASDRVDASVQAVLLYLYSADVRGLWEQLVSAGLEAGEFVGPEHSPRPTPPCERGRVYPVVPRFYMPAGELRVEDPDGYCLLIGQLH